ncbi:MAG: mechanosensitive ion channel family protein [Candidatus Omnitrophica bacterium]|nr:mechanosensitive ion channel family protein [Candidatus Omnitrophota bacterium]
MQQQMSTLQELINTVVQFFVNYSLQVIGAIIVLIVGFLLAKWLAKFVIKLCEKKHVDLALAKFLAGCVKALVIVFAVIIALGKFGITIAPFVAAIGAIAFGSTMAIQGPLSNYGAGLSIILSRMIHVGDTITVVGVSGIVQDISLSSTILLTEEGVKITIPNKHIVGEILQNSAKYHIVETQIGVSYQSDPENAITVIRRAIAAFGDVATNPTPQIGIKDFADSSVVINYRYWAPTAKYIQTSYAVNLAVYKALKAANIEIPFPQHDVHIVSQTNNARL